MRFPIALLAAVLFIHAPVDAARQTAGGVTVIAAKRAKAYSSPTRQIKARNEMEDVVIVLRVGGKSRDDFQKVDRDKIYVMAGDEKLSPNVVASGVVDGKDEVLIVVVGPKAMLDMTLFFGDYPRVAFTAEENISDELH